MVDEFNYENILKGKYNFDISKYFFGSDPIRVVIIIYIIISFIVNILYLISALKARLQKEIHRINLIIMGSILFINFLHTFSYLYEWVLQNVDDKESLLIDDDGNVCNDDKCINNDDQNFYEIGGLLLGNMDDIGACKVQGFFLVFSALCQDTYINLFFYLVNKSSKLKRKKIFLFLFIATIFPFVISIIIISIDGLGLNDKYCFIKKFSFDGKKYSLYSGFKAIITVYYIYRFINIIISSCLLYRIAKYISANKFGKMYIFKLSSFLIVQIFTVTFGLMYRYGGMISNKFNKTFVNAFLAVNTIDGVIFPLVSYFSNNMYKNLCCQEKNDFNIDFLSADSSDNDITTANMTLNNQAQTPDKSRMDNTKENQNNFSLSYL